MFVPGILANLERFADAAVRIGAVLLAASLTIGAVYFAEKPTAPQAEPMLKIIVADGHGSGFHIGHGYVLTAAHVVGAQKVVKTLNSLRGTGEAEVLWSNTNYDVALLRIRGEALPAAATLSCRAPRPGESVEARGNPLNLEFVSTWGKVAGAKLGFGPWRALVPMNIAIVPGQSGGPLYDANGYVVGMNVGVMVVPTGFSGSLVGIGYAVPGSALCEVMGRNA